MSNRVILLIRRSADYFLDGKLSMPSCDGDEAFWDEYKSTILDPIDWWNNSFKIPYMEFRKKFRRISAQLIIDSQFDMVMNHFDWRVLNKIRDLQSTWIVPQDEDDWPNPEAPTILRNVNPKKFDGIFWDVNRICKCNSSFVSCDLEYYRNNVLLSNAYAMRIGGPEIAITTHVQAQKFFDRSTVKYIKYPLSVKVDNPASMSLLRLVKSQKHLQDLLRRFQINSQASFLRGRRLNVPEIYKEAYERYLELVLAL